MSACVRVLSLASHRKIRTHPQHTASIPYTMINSHPVSSEVFRTEKDSKRRIDAGHRLGSVARAPGMLLVEWLGAQGCWMVHDPAAPVPATHTLALLTQISTHAVHRAWSRARVRDLILRFGIYKSPPPAPGFPFNFEPTQLQKNPKISKKLKSFG